MATVIRKVECPGYDREWAGGGHVNCGNTIYEAEYGRNEKNEFVPIWRCTNCRHETPRLTRRRGTNHHRAVEAWGKIRDEWKTTDDALDVLVAAGKIKSGALMVYSSVFNYHMDQLLLTKKLDNFSLRYNIAEARKTLEKAKVFVKESQ